MNELRTTTTIVEQQTIMSEYEEQWLTGFWEGDGSCGKYHDYSWRRDVSEIAFGQKDRRVLEHIRDLLGCGHIQGNYLKIHYWKHCNEVFALFCRHVVDERSASKINKVFEHFSMDVRAQSHEPTLPWIIGFFDAEGHIDWNNFGGLHSTITQANYAILKRIQSLIGGHIHDDVTHYKGELYTYNKLYLSGSDLRNFIPYILEYSQHETHTQELLAKIHALARDGGGVWNNWAREIIVGGELICNS